jgi:4'-phosphopantetheinyl transferase
MPIPPAVDIVTVRLDPPPAALPAVLRAAWLDLSPEEQDRASRFRFERDRRRFIVARARLRQLLAERLGSTPRSIQLAYGKHGKPTLAGLFASSGWQFNLSRRDELALYAFSRAGEVGVDVEALHPLPDYMKTSADQRSLAFFRFWTRKEALAKALGVGLSVEVEPPTGWRLHSFFPRPGFIAALAHR